MCASNLQTVLGGTMLTLKNCSKFSSGRSGKPYMLVLATLLLLLLSHATFEKRLDSLSRNLFCFSPWCIFPILARQVLINWYCTLWYWHFPFCFMKVRAALICIKIQLCFLLRDCAVAWSVVLFVQFSDFCLHPFSTSQYCFNQIQQHYFNVRFG